MPLGREDQTTTMRILVITPTYILVGTSRYDPNWNMNTGMEFKRIMRDTLRGPWLGEKNPLNIQPKILTSRILAQFIYTSVIINQN